MTDKSSFKLTLTEEQQKALRNATGQDAEVLELSVHELEDRIAPIIVGTAVRLGGLA